jgi:hypothetical protein
MSTVVRAPSSPATTRPCARAAGEHVVEQVRHQHCLRHLDMAARQQSSSLDAQGTHDIARAIHLQPGPGMSQRRQPAHRGEMPAALQHAGQQSQRLARRRLRQQLPAGELQMRVHLVRRGCVAGAWGWRNPRIDHHGIGLHGEIELTMTLLLGSVGVGNRHRCVPLQMTARCQRAVIQQEVRVEMAALR